MRKTKKHGKRNTLAKRRRKLYSKRKGRGIGASKITARPYGRLLRMEAVKDDLDGWVNVEVRRAMAKVEMATAKVEMATAKAEMAIARVEMAQSAFLEADSAEAMAELEKARAEAEAALEAHTEALLKWFAAQEEEEAIQYANPSNATFSLGRYVVIGG